MHQKGPVSHLRLNCDGYRYTLDISCIGRKACNATSREIEMLLSRKGDLQPTGNWVCGVAND
jgi:hypothetical protein